MSEDSATAPTAVKVQVSVTDCACPSCTSIRNTYEVTCPRCKCRWQQAFATSEELFRGLWAHAEACLKREQAQQAAVARQRQPRTQATYTARCGWCGEVWAKRFTTRAAMQRFLRTHSRGCYLRQRQREVVIHG